MIATFDDDNDDDDDDNDDDDDDNDNDDGGADLPSASCLLLYRHCSDAMHSSLKHTKIREPLQSMQYNNL
jgi:hypothetical protein